MLPIVILFATTCHGAEVWARKMEIVRRGSDYTTVLRDSVVLTDEQSQLFCRLAVLEDNRDIARALDSVVITSPEGIVYAESAIYNLRLRTAELLGRVTVIQESLVIVAPRLFYSAAHRQVRAEDGLVLENVGRSYRLTGRRGFYALDSWKGGVDSEPVLSWFHHADTVRATGRLIEWHQRTALATAAGMVRVVSGKGELICDTALLYTNVDSGVAWGNPEVWDSRGRASGDTMVFSVRRGSLERVAVHGGAAGVYATDAGDIVDVKGNSIRLWLEQGDIGRIEVDRMTTGRLLRAARSRR